VVWTLAVYCTLWAMVGSLLFRTQTGDMALLREETVEAEIERKKRLIRLLNPELGLINTRDPIPHYVAASGPRQPSPRYAVHRGR
jgi:hypothetical protein